MMARPRWMRPSWAVMVNQLLPYTDARLAQPVVRSTEALDETVDGCSLAHDSRLDSGFRYLQTTAIHPKVPTTTNEETLGTMAAGTTFLDQATT